MSQPGLSRGSFLLHPGKPSGSEYEKMEVGDLAIHQIIRTFTVLTEGYTLGKMIAGLVFHIFLW